MKRKVIIMTDYYLPSVKGGGPIQSIKNLIENLSEKIDFYVITGDRDLGDSKPFSNIELNKWTKIDNYQVMYTDIKKITLKNIKEIINHIECDYIYLNSLFSYKMSIAPIYLKKTKQINVREIIIAPRGQLSLGALELKKRKKGIFIGAVKKIGFYNNVVWHATAEIEKRDIIRTFGKDALIKVANNLTANYSDLNHNKLLPKRTGSIKIVFISRIHPKKNLKKAIDILKSIKGEVIFNIYGPIEDDKYWERCLASINGLPKNVTVNYNGILNHDNILKTFKEHHIFLFPTLGENYGHVISEALIGGCPVIISDQTPWRGLEKLGVGYDVNLTDDATFTKATQYYLNMGQKEYSKASKKAFEYALYVSNNIEDIKDSLSLFEL